jgi:DNA-binding NarL/FixJ family response regulator
MQLTLQLPSASGRAPEAPARIAIELGDRGLAAVLTADLALTPGLAIVRREERADITITDRLERASGRKVLLIGEDATAAPGGSDISVLRSTEPRLIAAATLLIAGGHRLEPEADPEPAPTAEGLPVLTARERQVAELLVEGASNKIIARRLGISVHTAKFHVAAVLEKLSARNRSDAVAIALRDGLVAL